MYLTHTRQQQTRYFFPSTQFFRNLANLVIETDGMHQNLAELNRLGESFNQSISLLKQGRDVSVCVCMIFVAEYGAVMPVG